MKRSKRRHGWTPQHIDVWQNYLQELVAEDWGSELHRCYDHDTRLRMPQGCRQTNIGANVGDVAERMSRK